MATGLEVLRLHGLKGLTARNLARELHSSVAPVYSTFPSMQALEAAVIAEAKKLLLDYARRPFTEIRFLNMGVGIATFARDEPGLFRAMFLERSDFQHIINEVLETLCERLDDDPVYGALPRKERMVLLTDMWFFCHGISCLICVGVMADPSDAFITTSLHRVGKVVSRAAIQDRQEYLAGVPPEEWGGPTTRD